MACVVVLTAAGSGRRLGNDLPKALVPLAGVPLVVHAMRALVGSGVVGRVIVTAPSSHLDEVSGLLAQEAAAGDPEVAVVAGGRSRQESVALALDSLWQAPDSATVLVHDAARAFAPPAVVRRVAEAVAAGAGAVVPGLAVTDTIKQVVQRADGWWQVTGTPERAALRAVQTPQGFELGLLRRAHRAAADLRADEARAVSDDAGLVELLGEPVRVVPGEERALKITTPVDLETAGRWLSRP